MEEKTEYITNKEVNEMISESIELKNKISEVLNSNFDVSEISAQIIPINTYDYQGLPTVLQNLIVLDAQDRFMFFVDGTVTSKYISEEGWINYELLYIDFILSEDEAKNYTQNLSESEESDFISNNLEVNK